MPVAAGLRTTVYAKVLPRTEDHKKSVTDFIERNNLTLLHFFSLEELS